MCALMVRMVSCVSVETNLLGHSKLEHRSDGNRFQCWILHIALLTLTADSVGGAEAACKTLTCGTHPLHVNATLALTILVLHGVSESFAPYTSKLAMQVLMQQFHTHTRQHQL